MRNIAGMMKQAQALQQKMSDMQEEFSTMSAEGSAGAGLVKARMNAEGKTLGIEIAPSLLEDPDGEVIADLVVAALNDAQQKIEGIKQEKMQEVTGGLSFPPGMKMPF